MGTASKGAQGGREGPRSHQARGQEPQRVSREEKSRLPTLRGLLMWHAKLMPLTQGRVAMLSSVGVCSLELAEAPKCGQKMGRSLSDRSLWPTVVGSQSCVILEPNCTQNLL